jgi:hypothetical protein
MIVGVEDPTRPVWPPNFFQTSAEVFVRCRRQVELQTKMANIGKIVAALFSGSQEATLALANLNFDFSLVKVCTP